MGSILLKDALIRITNTSNAIGIYGVEVVAKDDAARIFYEKFGLLD